jgi:hypothetical protein
MRLTDLKRNDVKGALAYWRKHRRRGDRLAIEALFMLFDDPGVLERAIAAEMRRDL